MDTQTQNPTLPSIRQLLKDSWQSLLQSILPLFILNVLGIVIYIVLGIIAVLIFILSGIGSYLLKNGLEGIAASLSFVPVSTYIFLGIVVAVLILAFIFVSSAIQIASILMVNAEGKLSVINTFKKSFKFIIPLFLTGLISFALTFGAFFVFVLPALLFILLLMFVQFEVILNNQRGIEAIKRSVLIVKSNFGAVFIRLLIFWLFYLGNFIIMSILQNTVPDSAKWAVSIFSFILNLLLGWFALAYQINLYRHASMNLKQATGKDITWMWVIALLGWLIAAGLFYLGYKTFSSGILN